MTTKFNSVEKALLVGVSIVGYPVVGIYALAHFAKEYFKEVIRYVNGKEEKKSIFIDIDEVRGHE